MEKEKEKQQSKLKSKILKILPRTVTMTFQNPPFSPGRDHRFKSHAGKSLFSGPMIPVEARTKQKDDAGAGNIEPTSPKISCMGQIKHKKKKKHTKKVGARDSACSTPSTVTITDQVKRQGSSRFQKILFYAGMPQPVARRKSDVAEDTGPPLGQMRRFASSRETFSNFDWKAQIAPDEERDCYSDLDERAESDDDDVIIPFSAPLSAQSNLPNFQPRKEINLWKRRTMAPPRPLQLNTLLTAK